ncbi:hypothetical protein [Siminovitchia terrae]|uniref:hypothetical protein n=1 Tax=Siminovitchia terrae TaxID=1914933 RepID=UPI0028B03BAE|nr:hypothetical protein [Siminovitchia terrae]
MTFIFADMTTAMNLLLNPDKILFTVHFVEANRLNLVTKSKEVSGSAGNQSRNHL